MAIPEHYSFERYRELVITGVEGKARLSLEDAVRLYAEGSAFGTLDISPIKRQRIGRAHKYAFLHLYKPDVFVLSVAQYLAAEENNHAVIVCSGIGSSVLEAAIKFQQVVQLTPEPPQELGVVILDQQPLKLVYDSAIANTLDPKWLLAQSLREQMSSYRI